MNRRILLIIEGTFPWYRGGVSEWVDRYIKHSQGCTFGIIQIVSYPYLGREPETGIYKTWDNIADFKQVKPPDMNVVALKGGENCIEDWLSDSYKRIKPLLDKSDIVHAANTGFAGLLGVSIKQTEGLPLVITEHAVYWKEINSGAVALECGLPIGQTDSRTRINISNTFQRIARKVYKKSDLTISVARSNTPAQHQMGASSIRYVPNGVDAKTLNNQGLSTARNRGLTIGWVGRCAHIKQPLRFIKLVEYLNSIDSKATDPNILFEMYLSQAGEKELENEVSERASGIPNLKIFWNEPAKLAMRHIDALCISSISEAQPLVVLEAIAARALPFGWKCGDLDSEFGYFFSQNTTVEDVADFLTDLWFDKSRWHSKIDQLFQKIRNEHIWEKIFKEYQNLFDSLVKENTRTAENLFKTK